MTYLSLFSGIEAASCAWVPLGWSCMAVAEIEPFPCRVLAERLPGVPNLGDVRDVDWSPYRGAVDVVVGGSPCQSFSVAGRRGGMDDPRGRLMLEYVRAVADTRPRWLVWENVPGVLSQDSGRAFGTLLGALDELGYSLAWRVLDAQFFGVAQRRRRVFLVGGPTVGRAAAVLLEPGCVPGGPGKSRQKRAELAAAARERAAAPRRMAGDHLPTGGGNCLTPGEHQSHCIWGVDGSAPTPPCDHTPAIAFRTAQTGANGIGVSEGVSHTVDAAGPEAVAFKPNKAAASGSPSACVGQSPTLMGDEHVPAVAFKHFAGARARGIGYGVDVSPALTVSSGQQPAVAYTLTMREGTGPGGHGPLVSEDVSLALTQTQTLFAPCTQYGEVAGALRARHDGSAGPSNGQSVVCMSDTQSNCLVDSETCGALSAHSAKDAPVVYADGLVVRRLTPLECERLQGFPDGWTAIEGARDGQRYRALGNSMAVPVMRWIGERIAEVDALGIAS